MQNLLQNKTGEITAETHLLSTEEIKNKVRQIGAGTLLIVNVCIFGLIWEK